MTSLEMAGVSLTLLRIKDHWTEYLGMLFANICYRHSTFTQILSTLYLLVF